MDYIASFLKVLSIMQSGVAQQELAKPLLECVVAMVGADRGYIVVRDGASYEMKHRMNIDERDTGARYSFSRSLVREAIRRGDMTFSENLGRDVRFQDAQSVNPLDRQSVIAAPLKIVEAVFAVIYLERDEHNPPFLEEDLNKVKSFLNSAGLSLKRALRLDELERFKREFEAKFGQADLFGGIVCVSSAMGDLLRTVAQVAPTNATVLIHGETGSGKELIARAIYQHGRRREKPFETLHCGALPETLFEAELFGHKRGAFTGADRDRPGRIAQASGGTLFIDEVAEIPMASQAKLLRFFQFGEFQRVGSDRVERVDVRIVAATHRDLKEMVQQGTFREDLYYRLNVIELRIPPLRERRMDILPLFQHFLKRHWRLEEPAVLSPALANVLETYDYPGNVRELEHAVERLCVMATDGNPGIQCLPPALQEHSRKTLVATTESEGTMVFGSYDSETLKLMRKRHSREAVNRVEREFLKGLLAQAEQNVSGAARISGLNRTYLYQLLNKHRESIGFRDT
ncbi:Sigma-54-dependent Fis family transcriptional regulator [Sulfidibacter corallicola]|uniref:Sigma-54-dependent Fis family transcriptional regulator n=1 Tax=Sulfidibacter corallicola TaxID=2818388 RepID=A0A8A4TQ47_SULCO|nr:sigma-54-dependent Fis family transcriptional regulator [Sulfidibacter corallicola]QTD48685.1 sigma-54-dependent Fis family transcriptional regulator [Sulfidibacter corallicola]